MKKYGIANYIVILLIIVSVRQNVSGQIVNDIPVVINKPQGATEKPQYAVIAPRLVRPASIYAVAVAALPGLETIIAVRASLSRDGVEITASERAELRPGGAQRLLMRVPGSSVYGSYSLRVDGQSQGTTVFSNTTALTFSPRFLTIIIQTSRPLYCAGQDGESSVESIVRFRIILLRMDMKPFDEGVSVYILDPAGFVMRRWVSTETNNGVVSLTFQLPRLARDGRWFIKVEARGQEEQQSFMVATHFIPLFEILVFMPKFVVDSDESFTVTVNAISSSERLARGNATLRVYGERLGDPRAVRGAGLPPRLLWTETEFISTGIHSWEIPIKTIEAHMGEPLAGIQVKCEVTMKESYYGDTRSGFSHTRIIAGTLKLRFLGASPHVFRPGMPFEGQIAITYEDKERVPEEVLNAAKLSITATTIMTNGARINLPELLIPSVQEDAHEELRENWDEIDVARRNDRYLNSLKYEQFRKNGVHNFKLQIPDKTSRVDIRATFTGDDGTSAHAQLIAERHYSPSNRFISVSTSTDKAIPGEYAIFHVTANFMVENFLYMVVSKGLLLLAESLDAVMGGATTLSIPVSSDMSPAFRLVVVAVTRQGELVSDAVWVPVEGLSMHKASLKLNEAKDHTRDTVEFEMRAQPGAFFGTQTLNIFMYELQAGSEITRARVMRSLHSFENASRSVHKVAWRSRDGTYEDKSDYFKSMSYGADTNRTFESAGLLVFTDAFVPIVPGAFDGCNATGTLPCLTRGCYPANRTCDGRKDCADGSDESDCFDEDNFQEQVDYSVMRQNGYTDLYQLGDGDWGWYERNIGHHGREYAQIAIAAVSNTWYVSAFSVSKEHGIAVIESPQVQDSSRPLYASIEGASQCRRGEQVGLRLMLFNRQPGVHEMLISVVLHASDDYKFVHVEQDGVVSSFGARLTGGEHHHLVWVPEGGEVQVDIPIAPTVETGEVEVLITASTQYGKREISHTINVLGEGAPVSGHTSVFLDLKSRATVLRYLDIPVEESPVVPYQEWRRYIFGSPVGSIILSSDLIGPVFPNIPLTTINLVDRWLKGTEARVSELAANVWTLHYLRLTNRLPRDKLREVLEHVTTIFTQVMMRFNATTGAFHNWDYSPPSMWVTSWTIRALRHASFQDWEDYFYAESRISSLAVAWMLENQAPSGSFYEPDPVYARSPLDQRMHATQTPQPNATRGDRWRGPGVDARNVTLTAHVLISLQEALESVQGSLRTVAASARDRAVRYLERQLNSLSDPYEISITAYALTLCDSGEKDLAFRILSSHAINGDNGELYWSRVPIPANPVKYENQRPFIQPAMIVEGDSVAVEATSYALLTYIAREGVAIIPERIVQWLTTVHVTYLGYYSTVESVLALQALTEFAFRARLLDITDMSVTLELPSSEALRYEVHVMGNDTEANHNAFDIPAVWGHLNVVARGHGQALVQMDVAWGVDHESLKDAPSEDCFDMNVHEYYSDFRNKSSITIQTCFRWIREHPLTSGAAVLEMELPTGYHMLESDAVNLARSGVHPTLREGLTVTGKTLWFFEHIPPEWTCFNHTVMRWYPAANLSLHRSAFLYEMYARERFVQVLVNSTPLYVLNICEVCGSYQCPYCPHYNAADLLLPSTLVLVIAVIFALRETPMWLFISVNT